MGLLRRGRSFLNRKKEAADGRSVDYARLPAAAVPLVAWPGVSDRDEVLAPSQVSRASDKERAFVFDWADFQAAGFEEPQEGDRIAEDLGDVVGVWQVAPRDREECWRFLDADHTRIVVHTRRAAE